MTKVSAVVRLLVTVSLGAVMVNAAPILDVASAITFTDPTQLGRLSRNNIPQDWAGSEPFPGVINPTTDYHYHVYSVNVGINSFVQIDFDDIAGLGGTFVSAYDGTYAPNSAGAPNFGFDTKW